MKVVDLSAFRVLLAEVLNDAAARGADTDRLIELQDAARLICEELERRRDRRRDATRRLVKRLQKLERDLVESSPGDRASAIRSRLGLSRTTYYRLRRSLSS